MAARVEDLSRHVLALAAAHCAHCPLRADAEWEEQDHLASFLDAVVAAERHRWSARMQRALYDAGDRMKHRLVRLRAFGDFLERFPGGKGFVRAIGAEGLVSGVDDGSEAVGVNERTEVIG
jgi:hypothetical protein